MNVPNRNSIHPALVRAYRLTEYIVNTPLGEFSLRVNRVSDELQSLMKQHDAVTAAFITAYNPYSQPVTTEQNKLAQQDLAAEVKQFGLVTYSGEGKDPSGQWPAEESVLVLGISLAQIEVLARHYGQNGFLWFGSSVALCTLRLMGPLLVPNSEDLATWRARLPDDEREPISNLSSREQAALMTVADMERRHWAFPDKWNLNQAWPYTRPDGSTMGTGTELDRQFKLVAAGLTPIFSEYEFDGT